MNNKTEGVEAWLIDIAEGNDNEAANAAMTLLRIGFDKSYTWCAELDYAVVRLKDCPE